MNIIEATKQAMEKGMGITNEKSEKAGLYLLPTNTETGYFVIPVGYSYTSGRRPAPRWNPNAEDILTDDWKLYSPLYKAGGEM